ncbi:MAG: response regulator [Anaerolineae bacterium]
MGVKDGQQDSTAHQKPAFADHVLVIDDQETVCEAVVDILALENIPVITALEGEAGVEIYRARQAEIGLVLLDLIMPGMDGHETLQALHEINPDVAVVLSSGYDEAVISQKIDKRRLVGFLKKPYNLKVLIETVTQHLG